MHRTLFPSCSSTLTCGSNFLRRRAKRNHLTNRSRLKIRRIFRFEMNLLPIRVVKTITFDVAKCLFRVFTTTLINFLSFRRNLRRFNFAFILMPAINFSDFDLRFFQRQFNLNDFELRRNQLNFLC